MSKIVWLLKSEKTSFEHLDSEVRNNSDLDLRVLNENYLNMAPSPLVNGTSVLLVEISPDNLSEHDTTISKVKKINKGIKIICTSMIESRELFLKLIRLHITDYIEPPINAKVLEEVNRKYNFERRRDSNRGLDPYFSKSKTVNTIIKTIDQIKNRPINLLLTGESGSGKEFFTDYFLKNNDQRKEFISVNCPAIPEGLLESELFGHEKGSFTGAIEQKVGKIEMANGGILFLDEIGDLPLSAQTKLLRVVQEKEIERVGGTKKIPVDFTLICATSKKIKEEIQKDNFRADLYYRIAEIELEIPALRNRIEDIDHLSRIFIKEFCSEMKIETKRLNAEAIKTLSLHNWPGNIRELRSVIKKLLILSKEHIIHKHDVLRELPELENVIKISKSKEVSQQQNDLRIEESERNIIGKAIQESHGNLSKAAKIVGLSRSTLYRKIKKYDLKFSA